MDQVLSQQWSLIEQRVETDHRARARRSLMAEALIVDPAGTIRFAESMNDSGLLQEALETVTQEYRTRVSIKRIAEAYRQLAETTHLEGSRNLKRALPGLLHGLNDFDPGYTRRWLRDLPEANLIEIRDGNHYGGEFNALIDEVLQQ
jgi:hypothetical protein